MARIQWRDFSGGLWLNGARDAIPETALRRANGVGVIREGALRSSRGLKLLSFLAGENGFRRFGGSLYQSTEGKIYRDGVEVDATQDDTVNTFIRTQVQPTGAVDYLFVAGGGNLVKFKSDGSKSKWGIVAPPDGMVAGLLIPQAFNFIDDFDTVANWTALAKTQNKAADTTTKIQGTGSLRCNPSAAGWFSLQLDIASPPLDLNRFFASSFEPSRGALSADQDFISLWVRFTRPDLITDFGIEFSLGDTNFNNQFSRKVEIVDTAVTTSGSAFDQIGLGHDKTDDEQRTIVAATDDFAAARQQRTMLNQLGRTSIPRLSETWIKLLLPKASFDQTGPTATLGWPDVYAVRVGALATARDATSPVGPVADPTMWLDAFFLLGGAPQQGTYAYQQTFKNSVTGSRSNPNPTAYVVENVDRRGVLVGNLQSSTDPQVDTIEVWRTVGNGAILFKAGEVANGVNTFRDYVADFGGMYSGKHIAPASQDVLDTQELEFNNDPPQSNFNFVADRTFAGRTWWVGDGTGRAYYSRIARPESLDGFIIVTADDDTPNCAVVWNDTLYVFTTRRVFRVTGSDEPFTTDEVFGVPGTLAPYTVVATPFGIVYQAVDGIRLFNGSTSELVGFEAVAPVLRDFGVENVAAFVGFAACYHNDEYWVTGGGDDILVLNLRNLTWRHMGVQVSMLYAENDDASVIASTVTVAPGVAFTIDDPAADSSLDYDVQTRSVRIAADVQGLVRRVFIDIDTAGLHVVPTLLLDDVPTVLPTMTSSGRQTFEYGLQRAARFVAIELTCNTVRATPIILYGIEADIYVPGEQSA